MKYIGRHWGPKIMLSSKNEPKNPFSVEIFDRAGDVVTDYSLTIIGVGATIQPAPHNSGLFYSTSSKNSILQMEGTFQELNQFLRDAKFTPALSGKPSWITFHVEKIGTKEPFFDFTWEEVSSVYTNNLEETIARTSENKNLQVPLLQQENKTHVSSLGI